MDYILTGIKPLDEKFRDGIPKGSLVVIAGRPAMGKTSLAIQLAGNIAKSGKRVLFFSLEMSGKIMRSRMELQSGHIPEENVIIDDTPRVGLEHVSRKLDETGRVDVLIIDYLQLFDYYNNLEKNNDVIHDIKLFAHSHNVTVIITSQLNRRTPMPNNDDEGVWVPDLSDIRKIGTSEQDADVILFVYRDSYDPEHLEDFDQDRVIIAKNNFGETGDVLVRCDIDKLIMKNLFFMNNN